ncbi:hypothetical protein TthTF24_01010 [Thermus thermophilus]
MAEPKPQGGKEKGKKGPQGAHPLHPGEEVEPVEEAQEAEAPRPQGKGKGEEPKGGPEALFPAQVEPEEEEGQGGLGPKKGPAHLGGVKEAREEGEPQEALRVKPPPEEEEGRAEKGGKPGAQGQEEKDPAHEKADQSVPHTLFGPPAPVSPKGASYRGPEGALPSL